MSTNRCLAKGGLTCLNDTFVLIQEFVIHQIPSFAIPRLQRFFIPI